MQIPDVFYVILLCGSIGGLGYLTAEWIFNNWPRPPRGGRHA